MQINSSTSNKKYLIICLVTTFFIWLIPFLIGKSVAIFTADLFYIPLSVFLVMISVYRLIRHSDNGSYKTWIIFLISAASILLAEHIWSFDELILGVKPFPSFADPAFLVSYVLWIFFFIMFIKPLKNYISKKIVVLAICVSCGIIIPAVYYMIQSSGGTYTIENTLLASYVIIDGIVFAPVSIGIILLFKGKINLLPSLMFFAILSELIGDVIYQITTTNGTYFTGNIAELFYDLAFVMFMFGTYDYQQLSKKQNMVKDI